MPESADPRRAGGDIISTGGGKSQTVFDTTNAVLLENIDVALVDDLSGRHDGPVLALFLQGRINKTQERSRILYLFQEAGTAALISELMALASRIGPAFRDKLMARIGELVEGGHTQQGGAK